MTNTMTVAKLKQLIDDVNELSCLKEGLWFQLFALPASAGVTLREAYTGKVFSTNAYSAAKEMQKLVYEYYDNLDTDLVLAALNSSDEQEEEILADLDALRKERHTAEIVFECAGLTRCL